MKAVRELGSERRETVRSISGAGVRVLRRLLLSTRGPGGMHRWCTSYRGNQLPSEQQTNRARLKIRALFVF